MKITRKKLRQLINEEMKVMSEAGPTEVMTYDEARKMTDSVKDPAVKKILRALVAHGQDTLRWLRAADARGHDTET